MQKILTTIKEIILDKVREHDDDLRVCSHCEKVMYEGYCIEDGTEYYCSDECLEANMTREKFNKLYDDGEGDSYCTEWEGEGTLYNTICYLNEKIPELDIKIQ